MEDAIFALIGFAVVCTPLSIMLYAVIAVGSWEKEYMAEQRQTNADKNRMLCFMQTVMKDSYDKYTYVAGDYSIPEGQYRSKCFTYIVCFNEKEIIVIEYKVRDGRIICINVLPIDRSCIKMKYKINRKGVKLTFKLEKTKMCVNVSRIVTSTGEGEAAPLGIYQENEVELLTRYLLHIW